MAHDHRDDPEVRFLAEEQGVSLESAAERIGWQAQASMLRRGLAHDFPGTFVALQVDPQDRDRLELRLYNASAAHVAEMRSRLAARGILGATDIVEASEPPAKSFEDD